MVSLVGALPGVMNAIVVILLVMCIYAMIAVEFFSTWGSEGVVSNYGGTQIELTTARGFYYGEEYYGNFTKALFTLFQVLTGESWCEAIARPLLFTWMYPGVDEHGSSSLAVIFFVSYMIV